MANADDSYGLQRGPSRKKEPILCFTSPEFAAPSPPPLKKTRKKSSTRLPPRPQAGREVDEEDDQLMEVEAHMDEDSGVRVPATGGLQLGEGSPGRREMSGSRGHGETSFQ